jgi:hypothetical protein
VERKVPKYEYHKIRERKGSFHFPFPYFVILHSPVTLNYMWPYRFINIEEKSKTSSQLRPYTVLRIVKTYYYYYCCSVPVLALPAPWARFLWHPLTAILTHMKKGKRYSEITIY